MKKLLFLLLCLTAGWQLDAQFSIGFRAGLSTRPLEAESLDFSSGAEEFRLALQEASYGLHGGLIVRLPLGNRWLLQPEAIFNSNRADYRLNDFARADTFVFKERYQSLDIPLMLTYKFGPLRLLGGPVGNLFINSSNDLESFDKFKENFDSFTMGWQAGFGLDIFSLSLDARYEGNFSKFGDHFEIAGQQLAFNQRPARWAFSVGYRF